MYAMKNILIYTTISFVANHKYTAQITGYWFA